MVHSGQVAELPDRLERHGAAATSLEATMLSHEATLTRHTATVVIHEAIVVELQQQPVDGALPKLRLQHATLNRQVTELAEASAVLQQQLAELKEMSVALTKEAAERQNGETYAGIHQQAAYEHTRVGRLDRAFDDTQRELQQLVSATAALNAVLFAGRRNRTT